MTPMTVEQLYDKLCSKTFQDTESGDFFYNFYLYLYPCEEFCSFMQGQSFGKYASLLEYTLDKDKEMPDKITEVLHNLANSDQFMQYIHGKIMEHVNKIDDGFIRPYVFLYGIGNIYPYLRTSNFLNRYEKYNLLG